MENTHHCPYKIIDDYMDSRKGYEDFNEPFFVFRDGTPVRPVNVRCTLRNVLKMIGLQPRLYGTHRFRIGRATDLIKMGFTIEQVKLVGRWRSNTVYKCIRDQN